MLVKIFFQEPTAVDQVKSYFGTKRFLRRICFHPKQIITASPTVDDGGLLKYPTCHTHYTGTMYEEKFEKRPFRAECY